MSSVIALLLWRVMEKHTKGSNPGNSARTRAVWWQGVGDRRPAAGRCWFKDHYTMALYVRERGWDTRKSRFRREYAAESGGERWGKGERGGTGSEGSRFPGNQVVTSFASARGMRLYYADRKWIRDEITGQPLSSATQCTVHTEQLLHSHVHTYAIYIAVHVRLRMVDCDFMQLRSND